MIRRQNLICLAIVLQGTLAKQRLWLTVDWLQTWNRICSHRDCETQRWIAKVQQRRSHGALRWTCRSQALETLGLSWKFLKAWSILEWIWRAVAIHSWGKVSQSLMYAEDLGFLFCIRQAFSFAGKPLRWQVNLDQTTSDMRIPAQGFVMFYEYSVLQYYSIYCYELLCVFVPLHALMLQVGQLRPRYARWRQASWAGKARCWTWSYWCGNSRTSKASWIGLLVFLVVWSALDSLWFTWSWIHYRKHSCISWVLPAIPNWLFNRPRSSLSQQPEAERSLRKNPGLDRQDDELSGTVWS